VPQDAPWPSSDEAPKTGSVAEEPLLKTESGFELVLLIWRWISGCRRVHLKAAATLACSM
jgi:hypothetical protein